MMSLMLDVYGWWGGRRLWRRSPEVGRKLELPV